MVLMCGEHKGPERLICHDSLHSLYLNCRNHCLALCLVRLLRYYPKLCELDGLLILLWKTFKFSLIKQAIFENAQVEHDLKLVKIIEAVMTQWLTYGESCTRKILRFEPLIDALDVIYFEKKDTEARRVRDLLLDPDLVCMLLLLSEVLAPINTLSKFLQASMLFYCSITEKVNGLLEQYKS